MNETIMAYVRNHYQLAVGDYTAETIKIVLGNAMFTEQDTSDKLKVRGRNIATGVPDEKYVEASIVAEAVDEVIQMIVTSIKQVLEQTPPELSADIIENGIVLTGGGSLLKRLPERLHDEIGIPVNLASVPLDSAAIGAGKMLKQLDIQSKIAEKKAR